MQKILTFINKYKVYVIVLIVGIGIAIFFINYGISYNNLKNQNTLLQKEIIAKDSLIKLGAGKASKLDNTFATPGQLSDLQKAQDKALFDTINKRNERILSLSNLVLSLQNKKEVTPVVLNPDSFTSYYPKKDSAFIQYDGNLNTKTKVLSDSWKFNPLKVNVTLTERKDGLWDTYLDAPSFINVNSIKVNSLPAEKYIPKAEQPKLFVLYGGLGVRGNPDPLITNKALLLKGALSIKDKVLIEGDYGTDNKIGLGILVKF